MTHLDSARLALRGIAMVGLTGTGIIALSVVGGLEGIALAFVFLYLALFAGTCRHRPGG